MTNHSNTVAILPVKVLENAKQRLSSAIPPSYRRTLAEAMYCDVLVALRRSQRVGQVVVVTADRDAALIAEGNDAVVIDDTGSTHTEAAMIGLEYAQEYGARRALLIPLDCPMLDPTELDALIALPAPENSVIIIPDRHGNGTNALLLSPPTVFTPAFGEGSRLRHVELAHSQGATPEIVEVPTLALDVDTPEDLELLRAQLASTRGGAAHTRGMLSQLDRSFA